MATIGKIREKSGLMLIIIGGAMAAFILGDLFSSRGGGTAAYEVGEIYGKAVTGDEYQYRVQLRSEAFKSIGQNMTDELNTQIRNQVWNEIVRDRVLKPEFDGLGLAVKKDEFDDIRFGNNILQNFRTDQTFINQETGQFYPNIVKQYFVYIQQQFPGYWEMQKESIIATRVAAKYNTLIKKGIYANKLEAAADYVANNQKVNFKFVFKKFNEVADSLVTFTDSDISKYYNEHKSEDAYQQDKSRTIKYVMFAATATTDDRLDIQNQLEALKPSFEATESDSIFVMQNTTAGVYSPTVYTPGTLGAPFDSLIVNGSKGEVVGPYAEGNQYKLAKIVGNGKVSEVQGRHILVRVNESVTIEAARAKVDSLKKAIAKNKNFAEVAKTESEDTGSGAKGGDLGWYRRGMMVPAFDSASFEGKKGALQVVETQFGVHLLEVTDTRKVDEISLAVVNKVIEASSATLDDVYNTASSFSINNDDIDKFTSDAETQKYVVRDAANIKPQDKFVSGIQKPEELIRWINSAELGAVSEPVLCDKSYVVAILTQINEEGTAPLENVKDLVERKVKNIKKGEYLQAKMQGTDLNEIAKANGLNINLATDITFATNVLPNGAGREPKVIGQALTLESGQLSVPLAGENAVFVMQVVDVKAAGEPTSLAANKQAVKSKFANRVDYGAYNALTEKADVKDERYKFF